MTFTSEHLQRRIQQALEGAISAGELSAAASGATNSAIMPVVAQQQYTRLERFKGILIERILPILNLTSYRNLKRAREVSASYAAQAQAQSDAFAQLRVDYEWLQRQAADIRRANEAAQRELTVVEQSAFLTASIFALVEAVNRGQRSHELRRATRDLLHRYFGDHNDSDLSDLLTDLGRAERTNQPFWEIRTGARMLSRAIKPQTYLEVGEGRGWSLAQVISESPEAHCYIVHRWINPLPESPTSPAHLLAKMREITGRELQIEFIDGNSHQKLAQLFQHQLDVVPPEFFDLITVNNGRRLDDSWQDLMDVFPRVRVGGALLFGGLELDDAAPHFTGDFRRGLLPESVQSLRDVWNHFGALYPNFVFLECSTPRTIAGIAIRMR